MSACLCKLDSLGMRVHPSCPIHGDAATAQLRNANEGGTALTADALAMVAAATAPLLARVAELEEQRDLIVRGASATLARLTDTRARVTALRAALEKYAYHQATCPYGDGGSTTCTCGLSRALEVNRE